jgi:hypothetical protein
MPLPPPPSTATAVNDAAIGAVGSIPPPPPLTTTTVNKGGGGPLASAVTITAASVNVTTPLTLLLMVGCCVVCRPSPAALSAVQICQPPPSCDHQRFRRQAAIPFCLPLPAAVLSLFYQASIAFDAPFDGWLRHSPPTQQHTNHITKLKTFPVSTLWTYFDLLRRSTCLVWCTVGHSFSLFSLMTYGRLCDYLISTDSYVHAGVCVSGRSHQHDADSLKIGRHNRMLPMCRADIVNMSATDKNVYPLRGGADRHKSRHCQPS